MLGKHDAHVQICVDLLSMFSIPVLIHVSWRLGGVLRRFADQNLSLPGIICPQRLE